MAVRRRTDPAVIKPPPGEAPARVSGRSTPTVAPPTSTTPPGLSVPEDGQDAAGVASVSDLSVATTGGSISAGSSPLGLRMVALSGQDPLLTQLTQGERFSVKPGAVREILGIDVTRDGLTQLYADCLPGTRPVLTRMAADGKAMGYCISWYDNTGLEVARAGRVIEKQKDGSLQLFSEAVWTNPDCRGRGLSARVMQNELAMLRKLSKHDKTCIALGAGSMFNVNEASAGENASRQRVGSYAWAKFGYDFADNVDIDPVQTYARRPDQWLSVTTAMSTLGHIRHQFKNWVKAEVKAGRLPDDRAVTDALLEASKTWKHPWDIASFDIEGLSIQRGIGGKQVDCHLGKAFLTSGHSLTWMGAFLVNGEGPGHEVQQTYCKQTLARAEQRDAARAAKQAKALETGTAEEVAEVLVGIKRFGGNEWKSALRLAKSRLPEMGEAIDDVIKHLGGTTMGEALAKRTEDIHAWNERMTALEASGLMDDAGWQTFAQDIAGDHKPTAQLAIETMMRVELETNPEKCGELLMTAQNPRWAFKQLSGWQLDALAEVAPPDSALAAQLGKARKRSLLGWLGQ